MPTLLDDGLVTDALSGLTDWSGDAQGIRRSVRLSAEQTDELLADVKLTADSMNHHPGTERSGDGVTFTLRTESEGGVTELDIAFASRIDDLIDKARGRGAIVGAAVPRGDEDGQTGYGTREDGTTRDDVEIPSTAAQTSEVGEDPAGEDKDRFEPFIGARSGSRDTPGVPLPDTAPNAPEPGLARPEGQGAQNTTPASDEGGPGDRS